MIFNYQALDNTGKQTNGTIEAVSQDVAIVSLQKRGLMLLEIESSEKESWFDHVFGGKVSNKEIVILSRQMSTLFEAQVSPLKIFNLLASETDNKTLSKKLGEIVTDIQGGSTISKALSKHPAVFSDFYVNMVKSGEETGKLNNTFSYLADHLDRNYEVVSKTKNALIYPAFVVSVFFAVMILMFTYIIPKISSIILESGGPIPVYTQFVFGVSNFLLDYGIILLIIIVIIVGLLVRYIRTGPGAEAWSQFKLQLPYFGTLYRKLYLSIIADNMNTMVLSGIPMLKALEVTAAVVDNSVYKAILNETLLQVKNGTALSQAFSQYPDIPSLLTQMIKVGEETGQLGSIFKTMAHFYQREVTNAIDTLVSLIEPVMIVALGLGVGIILASVLIPIYDIANAAGG